MKLRQKNRPKPEEVAKSFVDKDDQPQSFRVEEFPGKGRGVVSLRNFQKGDFLLQYAGRLISGEEGEKCEDVCESGYRFFFTFENNTMCIDATEEPNSGPCMGRLVNHGSPNSKMKILELNNLPVLCLFAIKDIQEGEELLYDYGVKNLPWQQKQVSHHAKERQEAEAVKTQRNESAYDSSDSPDINLLLSMTTKHTTSDDGMKGKDLGDDDSSLSEVPKESTVYGTGTQIITPNVCNEETEEAEEVMGDSDIPSDNDSDYMPHESCVSDSCSEGSEKEFHDFPTIKPCLRQVCKGIEEVLSSSRTSTHESEKVSALLEEPPADQETTQPTQPYKKPYRYCIFCEKMKSKLSAHIKEKHCKEERVKRALALPKKERDIEFQKIKKEGIKRQNIIKAKKEDPVYFRERQSKLKEDNSSLVICSHCSGFYSRRYISRHKKICLSHSDAAACGPALPTSLLKHGELLEKDTDFTTDVLSRFRQTLPSSKLCRTDPVLIKIGKRLWHKEKRKQDKRAEVRKSVMSDMRRLANLYIRVGEAEQTLGELPSKEGNVGDLFKRSNFRHLEEAIDMYTASSPSSSNAGEGGIKPGLKLGIFYLLKTASKIMKGLYLCEADSSGDSRADDIDRFLTLLQLNSDLIFGDATYALNQAREKKLRRPEAQPTEEDITKIKKYTISRTRELVTNKLSFIDSHRFTELRDLVIARLTLFNARRGGEPSRLTIQDWVDADKGAWLDKLQMEGLDTLDKTLAANLKVSYQSGKGVKHLVPILFPRDTHAALGLLSDEETRKSANVAESNKFLFPSTGQSNNHMSGWHALNNVCEVLQLENRQNITATKNRHYVSTKFSLMDVAEQDRAYIYKHLGHSEETNKHIYQAPLAIKAITVVGKRLVKMDEGGSSSQSDADQTSSKVPATGVSTQIMCDSMDVDRVDHATGVSTQSMCDSMDVDRVDHATGVSTQIMCDSMDVDRVDHAGDLGVSKEISGELPKSHTMKTSADRKYTRWTNEETTLLKDHFKLYFDGKGGSFLPGRSEVRAFLNENGNFCHDLQTTCTKLMNEIRKQKRNATKRLHAVGVNMCNGDE